MTNILLSDYNIAADWCKPKLSKYITSGMKVAVLAYSFRPKEVGDAGDWDRLYGENGAVRGGIAKTFAPYGVTKIFYVNYFDKTAERAAAAVQQADLLYLPWGMPDMLMARVIEKDLYSVIADFRGVVVGIAAGAQVQLDRYHITPGRDHSSFAYSAGFGFLHGIDIEVRYDPASEDRTAQLCASKAANERGLPVYGITTTSGIIVNNSKAEFIGEVFSITSVPPSVPLDPIRG